MYQEESRVKNTKFLEAVNFCNTIFNNLINSIDSKSMQLVDIWNVANIEIQRQNPALLEKVLDLIENSPEKSS